MHMNSLVSKKRSITFRDLCHKWCATQEQLNDSDPMPSAILVLQPKVVAAQGPFQHLPSKSHLSTKQKGNNHQGAINATEAQVTLQRHRLCKHLPAILMKLSIVSYNNQSMKWLQTYDRANKLMRVLQHRQMYLLPQPIQYLIIVLPD